VVRERAASPLDRRDRGRLATDRDPRVAELEARKEAKYREIKDAELDREQGKLSQADWSRQDAELRRDAIQILKELDWAQAEAKDEHGAGSRQRT